MASITNIAQTFVDAAEKHRDRKAIIEARTGKCITFAQLNQRADSFAHYFEAKGIRAGDNVILMVKPSIDFICLSLALFKLGTPIVLIDPGMGYKNLLSCIDKVSPKYLIGIPKAILFSKIFKIPFRTVKRRFCCGRSFGLLGDNVSHCFKQFHDPIGVFQPNRDDLAAIIFTTGSTGPPKGVRYEHSIFSAQLKLIKEYYGIGASDTDQPAFPLFALFSAALGACSVIPDMDSTKPAQVNPAKFVSSIKKHQVSYSFGSPAIWNVVSNYCIENELKLSSLKKVLMAGAPVPYDLMARVRNCLPEEAEVFTPYGATESLPIVSIESREVLGETWGESRLGKGTCVGRPLPGIEIKVIALSDSIISTFDQVNIVPDGEIGEIIVRGGVVTRAYVNNHAETQMAKIIDGETFWHRMGDVGYLDESGRLWFCGRRAHRVVTDRKTYYPIPCEAIINEHENVFRSALVGVRNHNGDIEPVLIVEIKKDGLTKPNIKKVRADILLEHVRQLAGASTVTNDITHFLVHPEFPVDIRHNAKIFREKLAIWAQQKIYPGK